MRLSRWLDPAATPHEPVTEKCKSKLGDEEILKRARSAKNAAKFNRLWSGDHSDYASQSEADMALCQMLAFWTKDTVQIDRLFRQSGLFREKWDRDDYWRRTIGKALERTTEHYEKVEGKRLQVVPAKTSLEFPDIMAGLAAECPSVPFGGPGEKSNEGQHQQHGGVPPAGRNENRS